MLIKTLWQSSYRVSCTEFQLNEELAFGPELYTYISVIFNINGVTNLCSPQLTILLDNRTNPVLQLFSICHPPNLQHGKTQLENRNKNNTVHRSKITGGHGSLHAHAMPVISSFEHRNDILMIRLTVKLIDLCNLDFLLKQEGCIVELNSLRHWLVLFTRRIPKTGNWNDPFASSHRRWTTTQTVDVIEAIIWQWVRDLWPIGGEHSIS